MNRTVSRVLWIIAGVLLMIAGIYCLCNPDVGLLTLSIYLGLAMLISGIVDIVIFAKCNRDMVGQAGFWQTAFSQCCFRCFCCSIRALPCCRCHLSSAYGCCFPASTSS